MNLNNYQSSYDISENIEQSNSIDLYSINFASICFQSDLEHFVMITRFAPGAFRLLPLNGFLNSFCSLDLVSVIVASIF